MCKRLLIPILFALSLSATSQVTYFDYLDYTCTWKYYFSGFNGLWGYETFTTVYLQGDTTINSIPYYKQYRMVHQVDYPNGTGGSPVISNYLYGPGFIREDAMKKFLSYSIAAGSESAYFDSQEILNTQLNDTMPYPGANCTTQLINTLYWNTTPLTRLRSSASYPGLLEGVGVLGPVCALGIEGNENLVCFSKQGIDLQLGTMSCNSFPVPPASTSVSELNKNAEIVVFPNPCSGNSSVKWNPDLAVRSITIYDVSGRMIFSVPCTHYESAKMINMEMFEDGLYSLNLNTEKMIVKKIILKQQ
jgi:hypothetical protein